MRPADLTTPELIDLLDDAYREDRGGPPSGLASAERHSLADDLGCHEEVRAELEALWRERLGGTVGTRRTRCTGWTWSRLWLPC